MVRRTPEVGTPNRVPASPKPIRRLDQRTGIPRLHDRVARVRRNQEFRFRPGTMQVPGTRHRTDHIVTPLHNHARNVTNLSYVLDQVILCREETILHEVMTFNPGKSQSELRVSKLLESIVIKEEPGSAALPNAPCARGFDLNVSIVAGQTAIIGAHHIVALSFGNDLHEFFPDVSEYPTAAVLIEPLDLFRAAKKDSAQYEFSRALRMLFSISE